VHNLKRKIFVAQTARVIRELLLNAVYGSVNAFFHRLVHATPLAELEFA
jgi:hypothetical protein